MNDIKQKLELIDKQLAGPGDLHKKIISTSPLAFVATGMITGIVIQNTLWLSTWLWLIILILFAAGAFVFFAIQRLPSNNQSSIINPTTLKLRRTGNQFITVYLVLACFACLGAIRLACFYQKPPDDISNFVTGESTLATIRGSVITEPYFDANPQWQFARFAHTDPVTSFYLKLNEVKTIEGWAKVSGTVRVQVDEPVLDVKAGDYIQAYCRLDRFKPPSNPGQFNTAEYLARRGVYIAASVKSRGIELLNSNRKNILAKIRTRLRQTATQALLDSPYPQDQNQGLLQALLLGYRANIDSKTYIAFRRTGLLHFVCLSGMNFGIVIGIIWWLCKTAGLMKPARSIVCIIAAIVFLLAVPPNAPALRAGIISLVFCASFFFRRSPNPVNSLSLAAIILLLIRPTELFEPSWKLSFAAILGLLLFCERIHFFLYEKITGISWFEEVPESKPFYQIAVRPGPYILRLFSTSLTAWLATAGISLYHFCTINWLTSIWTVLVSPLIAAISVIGYLKIVIALFLPTAASILGVILNILSGWLIWIVNHIADLNISEILIGTTPVVIIIFYYAFIVFAVFAHFRRPLTKKIICTVSALSLIIFLGAAKWQRTHRDDLILTCLDVGHGQVILAELPGKTNILFDAGSLHKDNIGGRIVAPFLDYIGINKIDNIIISHNDTDHINGIPEIVEHCDISGVYANDAFFSKADQRGTAKFLNDWLNKNALKVQRLGKELNSNSPAAIKFLWPDEQIYPYEQLKDNDKSLVCLMEFAGRKILLTSDIEKFAQIKLLQKESDLKADIAVVPHHGSARTLDDDFLKSLDAEILICSCSVTQYEKQQIPLQTNTAALFYTPRDGAVTIRIDKNGKIKTDIFIKQK